MVSVIINTVNEKPEILKRAIESYVNQKVNTQIIISTIEGDPSLKIEGVEFAVMSKKDHPGKSPKGSFMQLNNALPLIKGDWFCFASGNDHAEPKKLLLEILTCKLQRKEICYSAFYSIENDIKTVKSFHKYDFSQHLKGNFVSDCALISRAIVEKYLPFKIELKNYAYWDLWLRVFEGEGDVFAYNPTPTWNYIQNADDMHNIRKRSPEQIAEAKADREYMLSFHK